MADPTNSFTTEKIALSMYDPKNPLMPLEANVYRVEGVNNNEPLSMGGLVMALCLARASVLEKEMIDLMEEMEAITDNLNDLTAIEEKLVTTNNELSEADKATLKRIGVAYDGLSRDQIIKNIESTMDSNNSFSQDKMISLQSVTNKRDQAYDMIANILKSLNGVLIGMANNM